MRKIYINSEGKQVVRPKSLVIGTSTYVPPTDEQLVSAGYEIRKIIDPIPEPYIPTYAERVEQYIREHGYPTYGSEIAVQNNYAEDPVQYLTAWQEYMGVRHDAKEWAKSQPHREEE